MVLVPEEIKIKISFRPGQKEKRDSPSHVHPAGRDPPVHHDLEARSRTTVVRCRRGRRMRGAGRSDGVLCAPSGRDTERPWWFGRKSEGTALERRELAQHPRSGLTLQRSTVASRFSAQPRDCWPASLVRRMYALETRVLDCPASSRRSDVAPLARGATDELSEGLRAPRRYVQPRYSTGAVEHPLSASFGHRCDQALPRVCIVLALRPSLTPVGAHWLPRARQGQGMTILAEAGLRPERVRAALVAMMRPLLCLAGPLLRL